MSRAVRGPRLRFRELDMLQKRLAMPDLPWRALKSARPAKRKAAVLVALCNIDGVGASLLYTLRSDKVGTHKSQVSFAGGHIEPGEQPAQAAVREFREELGVEAEVQVLGVGRAVEARTGTLVTPVLGFLPSVHRLDALKAGANADEVADVFSVSIEQLSDPAVKKEDDLGERGRVPAFHVQLPGAPDTRRATQRIWGLTGFLTDEMLRLVILPTLKTSVAQ